MSLIFLSVFKGQEIYAFIYVAGFCYVECHRYFIYVAGMYYVDSFKAFSLPQLWKNRIQVSSLYSDAPLKKIGHHSYFSLKWDKKNSVILSKFCFIYSGEISLKINMWLDSTWDQHWALVSRKFCSFLLVISQPGR